MSLTTLSKLKDYSKLPELLANWWRTSMD